MNKTELIEAMASDAGTTKADASKLVNAFMKITEKVLKTGGQITIPGFGTFSVRHRASRSGRNPNTGEAITIKATRTPNFKAGKILKDAVKADD